MAKALIKAMADFYDIEIYARDIEKSKKIAEEIGKSIEIHNMDNVNIDGKNVVLSVKPHAMVEVAQRLKGKADSLYSILAGVKLDSLADKIDANNYIRVMPNLAALNAKSMTILTGEENNKMRAIELFNKVGKTIWVNSEKELDIATGVAGSGPAFLALVAEGFSDGLVKSGLKRADAQEITQGLFYGFESLLDEQHPALIKDGVMSPGGTTAAGYAALEEGNVRDACIKAVEKAYERAQELSKN